jgi:hypothetical protein
MDVMGIAYHEFTDDERRAVVHAHPRPGHFKEEIIQAFYDGMRHRPETTLARSMRTCLPTRTLRRRISAA